MDIPTSEQQRGGVSRHTTGGGGGDDTPAEPQCLDAQRPRIQPRMAQTNNFPYGLLCDPSRMCGLPRRYGLHARPAFRVIRGTIPKLGMLVRH